MKFEGGCATVTGYKLPSATDYVGKAGARFEARSQDIGLAVLVPVKAVRAALTNFSVKGKDEARLIFSVVDAFILVLAGD